MMKFNIRGDKMVVTKSIKEYVEGKLERINKYFNDSEGITANVLIRVRGRDQIVEVTIPTSKFILRSEEANKDLYASVDLVIDKLERQIRKNKTRLKKNVGNSRDIEFNFDYDTVKEDESEDLVIVKRKKLDMKPMDEEEAILEMELLGHDFFVYKDANTGNIGVLYKRKDGNYGIIETK